jgi:hypothetical protein
MAFQKLRLENQERRRIEKFAGCGWIKFFSCFVIPEDSYRGSRGKSMDSRLQAVGMTTRGASIRRIASLDNRRSEVPLLLLL